MNALSNRIIGCALTIANALGSGFLEKIYENVLAHELRKAGLAAVRALDSAHRVQWLNYLRATGMRLCLLMNFGGPRFEIRRIALNL